MMYYKINVINIKNIKDTSIFKTDLKYVLEFLRHTEDKEKLKDLVENTPYFHNMDEEAYDVVANYANVEGLLTAKEYCIDDGGKLNMCTAINEMMEDSRKEERVLIAEKMLKKNMPVEDVMTCTGLTRKTIQEIVNKM